MAPYNWKVWATPPELMDYSWIGERVSTVDTDAILRHIILGEDQTNWGPNSTFRYPLYGGTGSIYSKLGVMVEHRLQRSCTVVAIDPADRVVTSHDGRHWPYDALLSTMPLDLLVARTDSCPAAVRQAAGQLSWSSTHIVGVGLDRPAGTSKTWIYYPEPDVPFYRVTYLSNYSPHLIAGENQTLLLTETSTSSHKPEDPGTIVERVVDGLVRARLMTEDDRQAIVTTWHFQPERTYPVPSLERDAALATIEPWLDRLGIASRGRFGAWRYEIGNMDHSFMQGVEWVDRVLCGGEETVWTPVTR
jgi:protoporphyrinogen oxidase